MFWKDNMATGILELDEKIKQLVEGVNEIIRKMNAVRNPSYMAKHIDELKNCCVDYFTYQETMMNIANYPQYYQHKHSHEIFIGKIETIVDEYMAAGSYGFSTAKLQNTIDEWFIKHVYLDDKQFGEFYKRQKARQNKQTK